MKEKIILKIVLLTVSYFEFSKLNFKKFQIFLIFFNNISTINIKLFQNKLEIIDRNIDSCITISSTKDHPHPMSELII